MVTVDMAGRNCCTNRKKIVCAIFVAFGIGFTLLFSGKRGIFAKENTFATHCLSIYQVLSSGNRRIPDLSTLFMTSFIALPFCSALSTTVFDRGLIECWDGLSFNLIYSTVSVT